MLYIPYILVNDSMLYKLYIEIPNNVYTYTFSEVNFLFIRYVIIGGNRKSIA